MMNPGSASSVSHEIAVDIGGTPILLRTRETDFRALLERRYAGFLRPAVMPALHMDVELVRPECAVCEVEELRVWKEGRVWRLERGDFRAEIDLEAGRGRILQSLSPYSIDSVLRIVHTLIQARAGGFLLHAASAIRNGKAFLFSGVSGAGKTTLARLAPPDSILLTDEISYIRPQGGAYRACGTPFAGELARLGENATAPITKLFFLAKGPENCVETVATSNALRMLLRNILFFADDSDLIQSVFRSAWDFLAHVPAAWLRFYPDGRVWDLLV
jgi:hypothetical protein